MRSAETWRQRRRLLAWSNGLAATAAAILFALGAVLTLQFTGVAPAIGTVARQHAQQVAELTFESLYSLMLTGAGRSALQDAALRLEHTGTGLSIGLARGPLIVEQFGDLHASALLKASDRRIQQALATGAPVAEADDRVLHMAYPALFRQECRNCHLNAQVGAVAGVVSVTYPVHDLAAPQRRILRSLVIYMAISLPLLILLGMLFWQVDRRVS